MSQLRFDDHLGGTDTLLWRTRADPLLRAPIVLVAILDGELEERRFLERLASGISRVPRLRQIVQEVPLGISTPAWVEDPHFDISRHVSRERMPAAAPWSWFFEFLSSFAAEPFPDSDPLWACTVLEGLPEQRSAILIRVHHAMIDGVGGVELLQMIFELERDADLQHIVEEECEARPDATGLRPGTLAEALTREVEALVENSRGLLADAWEFASDPRGKTARISEALDALDEAYRPQGGALSPSLFSRNGESRLESLEIPLPALRAVARSVGCRLNAAYLAGLARGFRIYHREYGAEPSRLRIGLPVDLRVGAAESVAGNQMMAARCLLPLDLPAGAEGLRQAESISSEAQRFARQISVEAGAKTLARLPTSALSLLLRSMLTSVDFMASNLPGPPVPLFVAGRHVEAFRAFGPTLGAAVNATLFTYGDEASVGVTMDRGAVPEPELLMQSLRAGFREVLEETPQIRHETVRTLGTPARPVAD